VQEIRASHPTSGLIVLGDLNDLPNSQPLANLAATGLFNSWQAAKDAERYSYIYQGVSQTLDYVLWYPHPSLFPCMVQPAHINADYPYEYVGVTGSLHRSSDHDSLRVDFCALRAKLFLPAILK
jgi:predicted extracellular nuclease